MIDAGHLSSLLALLGVWLQESMKALLSASQLMDENMFCLVRNLNIRLCNSLTYCITFYYTHENSLLILKAHLTQFIQP